MTRIRPWAVAGPGANQVQLCALPERPVQPATGANVEPPSNENATSTAATPTLSEALQRMDDGVPVNTRSPPFA